MALRASIYALPTLLTQVVFDEMQAYHTVEIDLDPRTRMLVIDAESADGAIATTRAVKLPFGVTHPEQITAELTDGKVIITVPQAAREELGQPSGEPSPAREQKKTKRLKVCAARTRLSRDRLSPRLRPLSRRASLPQPDFPTACPLPVLAVHDPRQVHVAPTSAGELHVKHADGMLNITLAGMAKEGVSVDLIGKVLQIRGPVAQGSARINRRFKVSRAETESVAMRLRLPARLPADTRARACARYRYLTTASPTSDSRARTPL